MKTEDALKELVKEKLSGLTDKERQLILKAYERAKHKKKKK